MKDILISKAALILRVLADWRVIVSAVAFIFAWMVVRAISDPYRKPASLRRFPRRAGTKPEDAAAEPAGNEETGKDEE
ncbi:MAG: hypothetical protein NT080_13320 [Spirochaetes bacterium]|nr:hypothetical protein [Spirochaetota bacterium]